MVSAMSRTIRKRKAAALSRRFKKRRYGSVSAQKMAFGRRSGFGGELKFFDSFRVITATVAAGSVVDSSLNLIQQGAGESNRIGRKIVLRKIHIKGDVVLPATAVAADTSDAVRVIVFHDKQTNGATATPAQILAGTYLSFRNLQQTGRFNLLYDETHYVNAKGGLAGSFGEERKPFNVNAECFIPLEFDASTGAITDLTTNNVGVLVYSAQGLATINYFWRVRYSDN